MREAVYREFAILGLQQEKVIEVTEIREKDGICLYRVTTAEGSYVLKYFATEEHRREISYYRLLQDLGVPTIEVLGHSQQALLMEDLETSSRFRLGVEADLADLQVAKSLANCSCIALVHNI